MKKLLLHREAQMLRKLDYFEAIDAAAQQGDFGEVVELLLHARDRDDYQLLLIRALARATRFGRDDLLAHLHTSVLPQ